MDKMNKIFLLAAAAAVGTALYISCNQNAQCRLKKKIRDTRRSLDKTISKASHKIEKSVNKAIDSLAEAQENFQSKTEEAKSKVKNPSVGYEVK